MHKNTWQKKTAKDQVKKSLAQIKNSFLNQDAYLVHIQWLQVNLNEPDKKYVIKWSLARIVMEKWRMWNLVEGVIWHWLEKVILWIVPGVILPLLPLDDKGPIWISIELVGVYLLK